VNHSIYEGASLPSRGCESEEVDVMPPFIPQKRPLSTPPPDPSTPKAAKKQKKNLFDVADKPASSTTLQANKAFIESLDASGDDSSLSVVSSDEFEDAIPPPSAKKHKTDPQPEDDEDEIDWEDAIGAGSTPVTNASVGPSGDLELTLDKSVRIGSLTNPHDKKKGPSKIERQIRVSTHCMHVQFLLFHNLVRNIWTCDKEVQTTLVSQLPTTVKVEVEKWRILSGLRPNPISSKPQTPSRKGRKGKRAAHNERNQRDWGRPAERQEAGAPNMSRGDPIFRLLKILSAYWKKRFTITAPGLRKQGYKSLAVLEEEIESFRNDKHDPEEHGERIEGIQRFRELAKTCEGSRDVGAQLFTALIRGLGIDARLVASLQPVGFGWNRSEETSANRKHKAKNSEQLDNTSDASGSDQDVEADSSKPKSSNSEKTSTKAPTMSTGKGGSRKGGKEAPINLSENSLGESEQPAVSEDESVVDVTPSNPWKKPNMNYDRDMSAPTYWTEVISPVTNEVHAVDPMVLIPAVATSAEHLWAFEPRGTKADKAKQVFAYLVAYSPDGTAKDVTTRYLKRHMWPGRTKGVRLPPERLPVYNKRGKIKYHEDYDWFKTVMSGYARPHAMRTVVDDLEEGKDLKAVKPEKKETKTNEETLQGYKTSADFVLERHLWREEALRPGAEPVKTFLAGKGDKAKEEPVYRRVDVETCRTGESWHKEGRAVKAGEHPMKMVPVRAVTLMRKREVEEAERESGEKPKQGLYAWNQTDWIIPPPIENGVIPRNAFGNIDCYVPTMVPKGAVHIPLRKTMGICKKLGIDYAEAVTGFEFGNKRAVPIITGVVVAEENEHLVIDQWEKDEEERRIKEEGKREKMALGTWRKWLMGLRIIQRVKEEYGDDADAHMKEAMNPFTNPSKKKAGKSSKAEREVEAVPTDTNADGNDDGLGGGFFPDDGNDDEGGGFLPEGHDEEEVPRQKDELTIIEGESKLTNGQSKPDLSHLSGAPQEDLSNANDDRLSKSKRKAAGEGNGKSMNGSTSKPKQPSSRKKSLPKGLKGRASFSRTPEDGSDGDDLQMSVNEIPPRKCPRRKAAHKSTRAVKSRYFEHNSDEEGDSSTEDFEDEEVVQTPKGAAATPVKGRSLRARKSS